MEYKNESSAKIKSFDCEMYFVQILTTIMCHPVFRFTSNWRLISYVLCPVLHKVLSDTEDTQNSVT